MSSRSYSSSGGGGGYAAMANSIMDYNASIADQQMRRQLGLAQLAEQRRQHADEMGLRGAQLQNQAAMQADAIEGEMVNWTMKQRFTKQDQQELARQETAVSELQERLEKGEITSREFYKMIREVAPRVNYLQAKEQHTRTQAMAEQRRAAAENNRMLSQLNSERLKHFSDRLEDNVRFLPDASARGPIEREVDLANPTLAAMNPGLREQKIRELMEERGLGQEWLQQPDGKWQPTKKDATGKVSVSTSREGRGQTAGPKEYTDTELARDAKAALEVQGITKDTEGYATKLKEKADELRGQREGKVKEARLQTPEGKAEQMKEQVGILNRGLENDLGFAQSLNLTGGEQQVVGHAIAGAKRIINEVGIPPEGSDLRKKLDQYFDILNRMKQQQQKRQNLTRE